MSCPVFLDNVGFRVTSPFGYRAHPITELPGTLHGGIDIVSDPARYPTRIKPIAGGVVVKVKKDVKGYSEKAGETGGNYVCIQHDNLMETRYKHLAYGSIPESLNVGDYVTENDCIGHMGATGRVTGAHLHFEVCDWKVKGTEFLLDPYPFLIGAKTIQGLCPEGGDGMGYIRLTKELKYGDKGEDVKKLQWRLCQLSEEIEKEMKSHSMKKDGTFDGGFGKGTVETLKKVQGMAGLEQTGMLDAPTIEFLNSDFITIYKNSKGKVDSNEIAVLQNKVSQLEKDKEDLNSVISVLNSEKARLVEANSALQSEKLNIQIELNETKQINTMLENKVGDLKDANNDLHDQLNAINNKINSIKNSIGIIKELFEV